MEPVEPQCCPKNVDSIVPASLAPLVNRASRPQPQPFLQSAKNDRFLSSPLLDLLRGVNGYLRRFVIRV